MIQITRGTSFNFSKVGGAWIMAVKSFSEISIVASVLIGIKASLILCTYGCKNMSRSGVESMFAINNDVERKCNKSGCHLLSIRFHDAASSYFFDA